MACIYTRILQLKRELFFSLCILFLFSISASAQIRCGTVEYTNRLIKNKHHEGDVQFENWISKKIEARKVLHRAERSQTGTYQIPVVVHVVHNGLTDETNIPDAQVISQIKVLNDDFKRLNVDQINTPSEFTDVAGSMDIEFVLAKQTPEGLPTTGIVRVQGTKTAWDFFSSGDDALLKSMSYWPAEDYFNIWVCNLSNALGYTQFPVSNLPGLENSPDNRLTDGVVIGYPYFGTTDAGAFNLEARYDKGRTVTHEVGHFFGLRHIWGDDGTACGGVGDYVSDTPDQSGFTSGCPSGTKTTCTVSKMYQNYLDYTDDACMNMFTAGQVTRMINVLENCVRRSSLLTSHGLNDPTPNPDDLALVEIKSPLANTCTGLVTPSIDVNNMGTNVITAVKIQLKVNSIVSETKDFALNLNLGASQTITFTSQSLTEGNSLLEYEVLSTNNNTDGNSFNNKLSLTTLYSKSVVTPFQETFTSLPANWIVQNADDQITWQVRSAPNGHAGNTAMHLDFYDYTELTTSDVLVSPPLDLTGKTKAYLSFDISYASRFQGNADKLQIMILTGCSTDTNVGAELYNKAGDELSTAPATSLFYVPMKDDEWRTEVIDISAYTGQDNIRIAFVGQNMNGNNIYLDNVNIYNTSFVDLSLAKINSPTLLSCSNPTPKILVRNIGTTTINSFVVQSDVNGNAQQDKQVSGLALVPGDSYEIMMDVISLPNTSSIFNVEVTNINNGTIDVNTNNNQKSVTVLSSTASEVIPIREKFTSGIPIEWTSVNPAHGLTWESIDVDSDHGKAVYIHDFVNADMGDQAWLVSPMLDFSQTYSNQASVFFDRSYGFNESSSDELKVLASVGCGNAFDEVLYVKSSYQLANTVTSSNWKPTLSTDWYREFIDLYSLVGKKDVRLAFVMTNQNGNNLYLDNIEFYESNNSTPLLTDQKFTIHYAGSVPADFYIQINLPEQEAAEFDVLDVMGKVVYSETIEHSLNQDHPVVLEKFAQGLYIVRLHSNEGYYAQRILISK